MSDPQRRRELTVLIWQAVSDGARQQRACQVVGLSARTLQRWQDERAAPVDRRTQGRQAPAHQLSQAEREQIVQIANSAQFGHLPPSQIVPMLADQGSYVASESTFYRVLRADKQLAHRRSERIAKPRGKPRALCARQANQIYSWDITYLPTTVLGRYFYLYLYLDIFSRKIVAWQVYERESGEHASALFTDLCRREAIAPRQLTLHSDNGAPMKASTMLATLQALGVMGSLSRPSVSNDNPYSESAFKTLKYRPDYRLEPFEDLLQARHWVSQLVHWYNQEHRHSAISFVTPAQRHAGDDQAILQHREQVYAAARERTPLRWKRQTRNWQRITEVHLNPQKAEPCATLSAKPLTEGKRAA